MYRLVESICMIDGQVMHLSYHQARLARAWKALFGLASVPALSEVIHIPAEYSLGRVKCRVIASPTDLEISFSPYVIRQISSIRLVYTHGIQYPWKLENRAELDDLFALRGSSDEIIIVSDGKITDAYYFNVAASIDGRWYTPAHPLLEGTCRQRLLDEGYLHEAELSVNDLREVQQWQLFNAMTPPETILLSPEKVYNHR
jgi:4-amino-4-deoxychorismate lyase